jgi:TRAP-type C4-dicarboxylate transport system substrate-binding protein
MKKTWQYTFFSTQIFLIMFMFFSVTANAKSIELSIASFGAPTHCNTQTAEQWAKEIETLTKGAVKMIPYWGGSLLKAGAIFDGVIQGSADIGMDMPTYMKGRFPVAECIELPWGYPNSIVSSQVAYDVLVKFNPEEIKEIKLFYLASMGGAALEGNKAIRKMEDLKGLKIRSTGNTVKIVQALGGVPIAMPITETYDALRKKTVDCTLNSLEALILFKFAEVVKFTTKLPSIGYGSINWIFMSKNKWDTLPIEIQNAFEQVSAKYTLINAKAWDEFDTKALEHGKKNNIEFIDLAPDEAARWAEAMKTVREDHINAMIAKNIPGAEISDYIKDRMNHYKK